ncbi:SCO family protein [Wenzhouxiangella sp. XN24]|uniref:SCO family protein n=1 Tax=Wenzhouxiangella sp. XN24 TaxID=2713569 RepID=UPI0013EA20C0|nr:SCO family protein [Wenzhouxiangella sp. XN24]NGX16837.1 SCO family protein [Wenzhouxiangella sp. XN24]
MLRTHLVLALVALSALVGCSEERVDSLSLQHARLADPPWSIETFELVDHTGASFSRDDLEGRWTLLFSGFTHCPDICPATLGILETAQQEFDRSPPFRTVFVSVDPERDTPERLAEYLAWFNEDWIGVTGERDQLERLLGSLQMAHVRVPTGKGESTFDHATAVALIDAQGRMAAYWRPPFDAAMLREDLAGLPAP